jgi:hypothetical protein
VSPDTIGPDLAVPDGTEITEAQLRSACIVLAGKALDAAEGDWDAAGAMLRPVLEAVGALPYVSHPRGMWGGPLKGSSNEEPS